MPNFLHSFFFFFFFFFFSCCIFFHRISDMQRISAIIVRRSSNLSSPCYLHCKFKLIIQFILNIIFSDEQIAIIDLLNPLIESRLTKLEHHMSWRVCDFFLDFLLFHYSHIFILCPIFFSCLIVSIWWHILVAILGPAC